MLRDNLVGLIEPMFSSAGPNPLALCIARQESSDDRPPCLENLRPEGAESTLTENAPSPFHAEPKQSDLFSKLRPERLGTGVLACTYPGPCLGRPLFGYVAKDLYSTSVRFPFA